MVDEFTQSGKQIYTALLEAATNQKKCFAILFDPEDATEILLVDQLKRLPDYTTHIFVGGSTATEKQTQVSVELIKKNTDLPIILFPGDYKQITTKADGILFLSLLSGENPEYLIRQQIKSVTKLKNTEIEIMPTGYILIDGGRETAVERISNTKPLRQDNIEEIVKTALAGQYSGKKLIYLEAGSGALHPVSTAIIRAVKHAIDIPLLVGGGIRALTQRDAAYEAGADLVVVGTAFETGSF